MDVRAEILRRLESRRADVAREDRRDARIAMGRLAVFASAAAIAWAAFGAQRLHAGWLAVPILAFVALAVRHDRVLRARARARRAVAFWEAALARVEERWAGSGNPGERFGREAHLYALDLDLFGKGSLFELLCAARTAPGEERLARWLLAPASPDEVRARQRAVRALMARVELREELAVLGEDVRAAVEADALERWGEAPPILPAWTRAAGLALVALMLASIAGWATGTTGPIPFAIVALAEWAYGRALRDRMGHVLGAAGRPAAELEVLALLLARLEREDFGDEPRLRALRAALGEGHERASGRIAKLERLVGRLEWAHNQFFAPIAFLLLWTPLHGEAVERWRARSGRAVRGWLDAVAELEALSSLAGYAWEHPADPFPEIVDAGPDRRARFEGEALRHPLLPAAECVPNDVALGGRAPGVLLVSGSNMSGKSTYLRTVGTNAVLALAGAPVRAARLTLTPVALGATLRIQDSLQAGKSRFYAEITRLKDLMDLAAGPFPLLFLLDEILHGTNSHDRRIGAEALIRGLVERGAIGLVTTHDLALTELAGEGVPGESAGSGGGGALANAHFEDQVKDGEIAFDYRLRPGVVTHSNALALMKAVGLEV
jgi:hypothetical protein